MTKSTFAHVKGNPDILFVGSICQDTILTVDDFPHEDTKQTAESVNVRRGGNVGNTLEVLVQFPKLNLWLMSAMANKDVSAPLLTNLESMGVKTTMCLYRKNWNRNPSSYVIQNKQNGSRTIINHNEVPDITTTEFIRKLDYLAFSKTVGFAASNHAPPFNWIHFEGRNVFETCCMIDILEAKAFKEKWRQKITISVECEKPAREGIDELMKRGDVVFFSKTFAIGRGFNEPVAFLKSMKRQCQPHATLFCTWGSSGATLYHLLTDTIFHAPAISVPQVVDSTGAGDTFIAGVIYAQICGHPISESLRFACQLASCKVMQPGFTGLLKQLNSIVGMSGIATAVTVKNERWEKGKKDGNVSRFDRKAMVKDMQDKLAQYSLGDSNSDDSKANVEEWRNTAVVAKVVKEKELKLFVDGVEVDVPDWAKEMCHEWKAADASNGEIQ